MRWKRVTLVGVGLLGGSLGLALRQRRLARTVIGYVRRAESIPACQRHGAVDVAVTNLVEAVSGADLVVLCTPVLQMAPLLAQALPGIRPGTIITDVGSVKGRLVLELERLAAKRKAWFIGSHPMAGSEKNGVEASEGDLFENAVCVVTPTNASRPAALRKVERLWASVGGQVMKLTPEAHDALVSRSSHLPMMLAAQLVNVVLDPRHPVEQPFLCASGFQDTTRVASGSPEMWRDIVSTNRKHIQRALKRYIRELTRLEEAVCRGDLRQIEQLFRTAKTRRDHWMQTHRANRRAVAARTKP